MARDQYGNIIPDAPAGSWRVVSQVETTTIGPGGRPERVYRVIFMTASGVQASVEIGEAQYTPANVRAAVAAKAHQLDQVSGLTG